MDMIQLKELRARTYARALGGTKGRGGVRVPGPTKKEKNDLSEFRQTMPVKIWQ